MQLNLGSQTLDLSRPLVMGILNVTADSFSDCGRFLRFDDARRQAMAMVEAGADFIDVGGESTRPGAADVPAEVEIDRVVPVIDAVASETGALISIDTSKAEVMRAAVAAGACLINDVYALRREGALAAASQLPAAVCLMHMQGTPATMQADPVYESLPGDILDFLSERVAACEAAGLARDRLLLDPGFGFGKTDQHNLSILRSLGDFRGLGLPLLVGLSRKRTLGNLTGRQPDERLAAGLAAAVLAVERGAHIVRTHDVAATVDALRVVAATMADS
ncbi:dihydropteroate synthase [Woeseia oceani]|uniref:Dihydropteroate synthase n=1 Tax=Woeseia oceani TaxID=1548547 RepID=A0A193LG79_9GAMM|nr:dihydropteroate synthase [Woeseia oceani]ANO51517.1 dihydropteroate synthase [Woeseia oceani]